MAWFQPSGVFSTHTEKPAETYSMSAVPQLARIASNSGAALNFRCSYQASVMNRCEIDNNTIGRTCGGM